MAIKVRPLPTGFHEITQTFVRPAIYLDHWAIRRFSELRTLQDRLERAIHDTGGTLVLAHLTFAEFTTVEDRGQALEAEQFLNRLLPNVYFASFALDEIMRRERQATNLNYDDYAPYPDAGLLKYLARHLSSSSPRLDFSGMISTLADHPRIRAQHRTQQARVAKRWDEMRKDPEFADAAFNFKIHDLPYPALSIIREILRIPVENDRMKLSPSDGADLLHAVVPLAYCDHVLLDRRWVDFAGRVKRRLAKNAPGIRVGAAYSECTIAAFLDALERSIPA